MSRLDLRARAIATTVVAALVLGGSPPPVVAAESPADPSDVVLVLDFSASILRDEANRNRFGAALERIADRVDEISSDLVAGDATVTIVQFATKAADYPGCTDLKLLADPQAVAGFAGCLRSVAGAYRTGLAPALTRRIGTDTNYVAAMEQATKHLPADSLRPTLILFSDGRHDVEGVPISEVQPVHQRLFGSRSPLAVLPVGMGLDPDQRDALEAGLQRLQVTRDMPACVSGTVFDWPQVVFESADEAGNAVAVALQNATCTFTVAPVATPRPSPTAAPPAIAVRALRLTPGDGRVELAWTGPAVTSAPVLDYRIRCRAGEDDWIESKEGVSTETRATIEGLTNGTEYRCEVAAVAASATGPWTAAGAPVTPQGLPTTPGKPVVEALDGALQVSAAAIEGPPLSGYHYECSSDGGATWPAQVDIGSAANTSGRIGNLTNGVAYVCRAFASNAIGLSAASPLSDPVRPCASFLDCNALAVPILGVLGLVLAGGLLAAFVALFRGRTRGYVVAVVDVVHVANLGHGSRLGIAFVRDPARRLTGIVADRGPTADIRIRQLRGDRFEVTDRLGTRIATSGEPIVASDPVGVRHQLVLRAFATNPASAVTSRR